MIYDMNILFLGLLYYPGEEKEVMHNSTIGLQGAANTFQWNIIHGIEENFKSKIDICSTIPIGTFPQKYKQLLIRNRVYKTSKVTNATQIGFINLPLIKQVCRKIRIKQYISRWLSESQDNRTIIIYSVYTPFLQAIKEIKNKYDNIHTCLIIPDLPLEYGIMQKNNLLEYFIHRLNGKYVFKLTNLMDSYVLLTDMMKKPLQIYDKPYVIVEGICSNINETYIRKDEETKFLLYTGTLDKVFGINNLIDAFKEIDKLDYELWVCGSGDYQGEIEEISKINPKIKYLGYCTKEQVLDLQRRATILVNPRTNEGEYTKYSFPSKTIEYMASGTPTLMYKLDGIPDEYDKYLIYFKGNSIEEIKESIINVCNKNVQELIEIGNNARDFVLKEKNYLVQTKKIIDMIESVN